MRIAAANETGDALIRRSLPIGTYFLRINDIAASKKAINLQLKTAKTAAPTSVVASNVSGTEIRLNWVDTSTDENSFRVERMTKSGLWRKVVSVPANTTAAVISGLKVGTGYNFRVRAYGDDSAATSVPAPMFMTSAVDTTAWYKIKSVEFMGIGEASWDIEDTDMSARADYNQSWVHASSWQFAVYLSLQGEPTVITDDGDRLEYSFPSVNEFRVDTAKVLHDTIANNDLSDDPDLKVIALEDQTKASINDNDYDDFYWKVDITSANVKVKELISNQWTDQEYNKQTNPGGEKSFMLVGNRSDDKLYMKATMEFTGDAEEMKKDLKFGYSTEYKTTAEDSAMTATFDGDTASFSGKVEHVGGGNANETYVIFGFDNNQDGKIDVYGEDNAAEYAGKSTFKVVDVDHEHFEGAILNLTTFNLLNPLLISRGIFGAFLQGTGPSTSTNTSIQIPGTEGKLDHRVGLNFDADPNTILSTFASNTDVSQTIAQSYNMRYMVDKTFAVHKAEMIATWAGVPEIGDDQYLDFEYPLLDPVSGEVATSTNFTGNDLHYAFGNVDLVGSVKFKIRRENGASLVLTNPKVTVTGEMNDVIDYRYALGSVSTDFVSLAAVIQAGHATIGVDSAAGRIFKVKALLNYWSGTDFEQSF